jgi:hypothetical protein
MAMRPILTGTDPFGSMRSRSTVIDCIGWEAGMQRSVGLGVIANKQPDGHRAGPDRMRSQPRPPSAGRWRCRAAAKCHMSGLTSAGLAHPRRSLTSTVISAPESS